MVVLIVVPKLLLHPLILSSPFLVCCERMLHEKPQVSILLEVDLLVCPESDYYYMQMQACACTCTWAAAIQACVLAYPNICRSTNVIELE